VIIPFQSPLLDKTQHSQETGTMPPEGFEAAIPASELPQARTLQRAGAKFGSENM